MSDETKKKPAERTAEQIEIDTRLAKEETAQIELELKRQELAEMGLRKRERELALKDLQQRVGDRELKDKQLQNDRASQGQTFRQQDNEDRNRWSVCTHKKGGTAHSRDIRVLSTGGNSTQYAVIKHQMINGDMWVRCLRCGRTWKPPLERDFYFAKGSNIPVAPQDGTFNVALFEKAQMDYIHACQFETGNVASASIQCRFERRNPETGRMEDARDIYRDLVGSSNLR